MTTTNRRSNSANTQTTVNGREFAMERTFNAPRELVFKVFADAEHLKQWWGPKGWTLPFCEVDFRPGGTWLYCMRGEGPDGGMMEAWGKATYREIVAPERVVYLDTFVDDQGNQLEGMPAMVITVDFIEEGGKTKLRSTTEFATVADLEQTVAMGMVEGMTETWDRLEEYLAKA